MCEIREVEHTLSVILFKLKKRMLLPISEKTLANSSRGACTLRIASQLTGV